MSAARAKVDERARSRCRWSADAFSLPDVADHPPLLLSEMEVAESQESSPNTQHDEGGRRRQYKVVEPPPGSLRLWRCRMRPESLEVGATTLEQPLNHDHFLQATSIARSGGEERF